MSIQPLASLVVPWADTQAPTASAPARTEGTRATAATGAQAPPSPSQLASAVKQINQALPASAQGLEFSIDADSNQTIVKVVDQHTKEVLRQIPSTEALEIARSLDKFMGLLIKQQA